MESHFGKRVQKIALWTNGVLNVPVPTTQAMFVDIAQTIHGPNADESFFENVHGFGSPVKTLKH
jgi:hypothetical protein